MLRRGPRVTTKVAFASAAIIAVSIAGPTSRAEAIIDGDTPLANGVTSLPAVVQIFSDNGARDLYGQHCTGTLIGAKWVITAQHCMWSTDGRNEVYSPSEVKVSFRQGRDNPAFNVRAVRIFYMSNYGDRFTGGDDLALIELPNTVTNVTPIPLLDGGAFASVQQVERWGYGLTNAGSNSGSPTSNPKRSIEGVWRWSHVAGSGLRTSSPGGRGNWYVDSALGTYGITGGGHTGDSGGPTLVKLATGQYALAGVTYGTVDTTGHSSRDPYTIGVIGLSNRVDTHSRAWNFIRSVFPAAPTARPTFFDGTLVKEASTVWVYVIYGGAKFRIPDAAAFNALGFSWGSIITVPDRTLDAVPTIPQNGTILREYTNPNVYRINDGRRRLISPGEYALREYGSFLRYVPDGGLGQIPL